MPQIPGWRRARLRPLRCALSFAALLLGLAVSTPPARAQIYDSQNVVLLAQLDLYADYNDVWGFVGTDGREYLIQGTTTGTAWWDVEDPVNPVQVAFIPGGTSTWRDMFVIGTHAYIGTENSSGGIQIVDIADPTAPTLVATYTQTVGNSHNVFGDPARQLLFVVGGFAGTTNGGLQIFDASDPVNLVEIGQWDNRYIHDMSIRGNLGLLALINDSRFRQIDLTDPTAPVNFGTAFVDPTGSVHATWPLDDGIHVAIAEETNGGHIKILDTTDPDAIGQASEFDPFPGASAHNVHVQGDRLYVSWYARGTRILDVSDPTAPVEIGYFDTYPASDTGGVGPGNWGVYPHLPSGTIASNGDGGLFLLKYDPTSGILDGTVQSSGGGPIDGASVQYVDLGIDRTTDATGAYRFTAFAGSGHVVRASAFGHLPDSVTVALPPGATVTTPIVLTKLPAGALAGTVTETGSGDPIPGVAVSLRDAPLATVTDANGDYSFPDVPADTWTLDLERYGYGVVERVVVVSSGQAATEDFDLPAAPVLVDFSDPAGWSVADGGATAGVWEFVEPRPSVFGGTQAQPDLDHTLDPEDQAAITQNGTGGAASHDVDGGATHLLSPVYDLSGMSEPHLLYYRWTFQSVGGDAFRVEATTNGGGSWVPLEVVAASQPAWTGVDHDLVAALGGAPASVQFRFTAEDLTGQIVEGGLDDFTIWDATGGAVGVAQPTKGSPFRLELSAAFPNPSRESAGLSFALPARQHVRLSVFDVLGRRVATLVDEPLEAGRHAAAWDGRDLAGRATAPGVYFVQLAAGPEIRTRKLVRVR